MAPLGNLAVPRKTIPPRLAKHSKDFESVSSVAMRISQRQILALGHPMVCIKSPVHGLSWSTQNATLGHWERPWESNAPPFIGIFTIWRLRSIWSLHARVHYLFGSFWCKICLHVYSISPEPRRAPKGLAFCYVALFGMIFLQHWSGVLFCCLVLRLCISPVCACDSASKCHPLCYHTLVRTRQIPQLGVVGLKGSLAGKSTNSDDSREH